MERNLVATPGIKSKNHFVLLDALRGSAALFVLVYHVFEGFATSAQDQVCNHGYLAVDFFFMLSGFVIAMPTMTVGQASCLSNSFRGD